MKAINDETTPVVRLPANQLSHGPLSTKRAGVRRMAAAFDLPAVIAHLASPSHRIPLAFGFYAVAAAVCTFPLVLHLVDSMPPAPDTLLHSWILAWDIHALTTDPLHLYDANIYFPFPLSLTYSDAMLSGAILVAPVLLLTGNPVLAHNILTLASLFIAGIGMFLLVRALTRSDAGGLVAGSIFGFCASRQAHLEHVNLLQFGWLPLALLYLHQAINRGRLSDFLLLAFFTVCQVLASVYLAWMMAIAFAIFIAVEVGSRRAAWKLDNMACVAGALLLAALIVLPMMWPYARVQQIYQFQWPSDVIGDLSAVPSDYLSVPPQNFLYAQVLSPFAAARFPTEHILFPGILALVLSLIALARRSMNVEVEVVRYSLIGLVAFVLSFGPFLHLAGQDAVVPLPYFYLFQFAPGFAVMRVPSRFDFLLMLALGVLAGFGVARLSAALARWTRPPIRWSILLAVLGLTVLELVPRPQFVTNVPVGAAVPPVYSWLRAQDPRDVVAEIPVKGPTGFAAFEYEYLSIYHWHPLVNGSSGFEPPASTSIANELDAFPALGAVEHLRSVGVRYIIAHLDELDDTQRHRLDDADTTQSPLQLAATFGRDVVYELAPRANPASVQDHVRLDFPALVGRAVTPAVTATITNDTPYPLFIGAPEAVGAQIEWDHDGQTEAPLHSVPVFLEPGDQVRLGFPAQLSSKLATADSAQLRVRLTGSVQLEASQMVRIADLPTSIDRTGLAAVLQRVQLPEVVHANTLIPIEVTAQNTGRAIWLPDPSGVSGTKGVVGVSVRGWARPDGSVWPPSDNSTAHIPWTLDPGQAAVLTIHTSTPPIPGHYSLVLDMLSESVTWFDDVGGGAKTVVPVDVEP